MERVTLRALSRVEDPETLGSMMADYLTPIAAEMVQHFPDMPSVPQLVDLTLSNMDSYLPPNGRTLVAEENGRLIGCGLIKRIRPDAAEMKRLYVVPAARGTGLGGRLIDALMAEARDMGCDWMYLDTGKHMTGVQALYEKRGFGFVDPYPESENGPEMAPHLVFMRRALSQPGG